MTNWGEATAGDDPLTRLRGELQALRNAIAQLEAAQERLAGEQARAIAALRAQLAGEQP